MPNIWAMAGMILVVLGYVPQIHSLVKTRSSEGISLQSWQIFLAANICVLLNAIPSGNSFFILYSASNVVLVITVIALVMLYRGITVRYLFSAAYRGSSMRLWDVARYFRRPR